MDSDLNHEDPPGEVNPQNSQDRPVLRLLPHDKRPVRVTACETCAYANWFATEVGLNAYCRRMFLLTWPVAPNQVIKLCDGQMEPPEDD